MIEHRNNINEAQNWEHIENSLICSQNKASSYENATVIVLIDNDGNLVYQDGNTYYVGDKYFTLTDGVFTFQDTSITLPTRTYYTDIERLYIALGYPLTEEETGYDIDIASTDFKELLQVLTMMVLKDMKLINSHFTLFKQRKYGEHIFNVYLSSVTGSGSISAKNKSVRWLNEEDSLQLKAKLFETSGYQVKVKAMHYTPKAIANTIMEKVLELLYIIRFKEDDIACEILDFTVTVDNIQSIKLIDTILLLNNCIGYTNGFIIRPQLTDRQNSRVYSVFTSIGSRTRDLLGFINYDIGSALQTICLQLVDKSYNYPLHQKLAEDKVKFRASIMNETGKDRAWVKTELSKIDNLDKMPKRYKNYPTLQSYFSEAQNMRAEIIADAEANVLDNAKSMAKVSWQKEWMENDKKYDFIVNGHKEASLFFFIWTQYEREIRHAMMSCFDKPEACHQVHDAVYSRQKIDATVIEATVLENTGFDVKISS